MVRPPLRDVAALAGVSEPTVSRVLNGKQGVTERTRTRVIDALESLGFTDVPAPGRKTRRGVVGIVTGELSNPVFPTFLDSLSQTLARNGFLSTVVMTDPILNPEERCVAEFRSADVDGIIFLGGRHAERNAGLDGYRELIAAQVPIVLVNGQRTDLDAPHILCDEGAGARRAVDHLLSLGHERIGCVLGSAKYVPTQRILQSYHAAMDAGGTDVPPESVVHTAFTFEGGRAGAMRLIDRGLTGLLTSNDLMALGTISAASTLGRSVPEDVSVVGYDGTGMTALTAPPLTTLRQPFEEMTKLAADAIIDEVEGGHRFRDHYVFEPELVSRDSSGRVASVSAG